MPAFSIAIVLSSLVGFLWLAMTAPDGSEIEKSDQDAAVWRMRFDAGMWSLAGGILGARIVFVITHLGYYGSNPAQMLQIWKGGLSWSGAAAGALLALYLYARAAKRPFWELADALAAPTALLALGLWIGCQIDHCAYGVEIPSGPWAVVSADIFGVVKPRWPTQIVGAISSVILLSGVVLVRVHLPRSGILASLTLALLAVMMLLLSLVRGDPVGTICALRLDTLGALTIMVAALVALAWRVWRK